MTRPMSDMRDVARRIGGFANDMKDKGIHVGMRVTFGGLGGEVRCVCCDQPWPCKRGEAVVEPAKSHNGSRHHSAAR